MNSSSDGAISHVGRRFRSEKWMVGGYKGLTADESTPDFVDSLARVSRRLAVAEADNPIRCYGVSTRLASAALRVATSDPFGAFVGIVRRTARLSTLITR